MSSDFKKGKVKFFNFAKGYGFIEHGEEDYFVHVTDIQNGDILLEEETVRFKPVQGHKGWQAIEVQREEAPDMEQEIGTVKFYNEDRGYGFVEREGKADVFAHFTDIVSSERDQGLTEGQEVQFFVRRGRDGRDRAYKISFVKEDQDDTDAI